MIDPAAAPAASPLGNALALGSANGAPAPAASGNPADPAAFAHLLGAGDAAAPANPALPAAQPMPLAARQVLAAVPAIAVATGKIVPDLLPPTEAANQPAATPAGLPVPVLPLLRALRPLEPGQPARTRAMPQPNDETTPAALDPAGQPPLVVPALIFALTPGAAPAEPAAATTATANAAPAALPGQFASAALLLPPAVAAQLMGQALTRQAPPPVVEPAAPDEARTLHLPAAPAPATTAEAQFTLASPAAPIAPTSLRLRPVVEAPAAPASDGAPASPMPAPLVDAAPALQNSPAAAAPAGLPGLGHSFAAVVDRLMAARDAVQVDGAAQPVAVNLRHAEFGTVSVRFEQRADGLSVALASPDPDFARAVQAATPSNSGSDAGFSGNQGGNGPAGSWTGGTSGSGAQGQPGQRSAATTQSERFPAPSANPRAESAAPSGENAPRGIYA